MKRRVGERRLVDVLVSHLRKSGEVAREVSHYEKRIDLVVIPDGTGELLAIEAKTKDWSRALSQAIVNLATADRSYVAMHAEFVHRVPVAELKAVGIGLISVGSKWGEVEVLHEAAPSPWLNKLAADRLRSQLLPKKEAASGH